MRAIKRIWLVCFSFLLLIMNTVLVHATGTVAILSSEDVIIQDKVSLVPINITNNPGIIAFKITCEYDSSLIEIVDIIPGNVISTGTLFHNLGLHTNTVDVSWYDVSDHNSDGVLFVISLKPTDKLKNEKQTHIEMTVSQEDTFNSQFNDVVLDCNTISISYGESPEQNATSSNPIQETASEVLVTDAQVIDAVDAALGNTESGSIDDVDSDTVAEVNDNLRTIAGPNAPQFNSVEELRGRYGAAQRNEYLEQARRNLEPSAISNTLTGVLEKRNASSFSELSGSEKSDAVAEAYQKMHEADDTLPDISDYLNVDESAEVFDSLISDAPTQVEEGGLEKTQNNGLQIHIIIVITLIILCCIVCIFAYKKKARVLNK